MAVVLLGMEDTSLNDSVFSLLDDYWYSQFVLNYSKALRVPLEENAITCAEVDESASSEVDSKMLLRFFEAEPESVLASILEECSSSDLDDDIPENCNTGMERRNSMDAFEMRRVFNRFDENADGLICVEELRRYMSCWGIDLSDTEANSLLKSVDHNNDGFVDFEEFYSLYQTYYHGETTDEEDERARKEDDLLEAFRVFDRNQDGFISAQELQAVLLNLGMPEGKSLMSCENMIRNVDRDGNGQCDIQEFQKMMSAEAF